MGQDKCNHLIIIAEKVGEINAMPTEVLRYIHRTALIANIGASTTIKKTR